MTEKKQANRHLSYVGGTHRNRAAIGGLQTTSAAHIQRPAALSACKLDLGGCSVSLENILRSRTLSEYAMK
jgi:hypothetical protein